MSLFGGAAARPFTIAIAEDFGSFRMQYSDDKLQTNRTYRVAWDDRLTALVELLGGFTASSGTYQLWLPHRDPTFPGIYAIAANMQGEGGDGAVPEFTYHCSYEQAVIDVTYGFREYGFQGESAFIEEAMDGAAEFLTVKSTGLYWSAGGGVSNAVEFDEVPGLLRKMYNYSLIYHNLPNVPSTVWDYVAKVNSGTHTSHKFNLTFAAGEMLYGMPSVREHRSPDGSTLYDISLNFTCKPGGWNKTVRAGYTDPQTIYIDDGGGTPYDAWAPYTPADFSAVLPW